MPDLDCEETGSENMNVLLINPPSPYLANDSAYPPMGLMYLASSIIASGHSAKILDLSGTQNWESKLNQDTFDGYHLVGVTCVTPNVNNVKYIIQSVPEEIPVMVGGPHPTHCQADSLGADIIVIGEAENAIPIIMHDLRCGTIQQRYAMQPPAVIPKPARHLVDMRRYKPGGEDAAVIYTSRGCNFNCRFCSKHPHARYREVPIPQVIEEVQECRSRYGYSKFVFGDDNLAMNPHWLSKLLDALAPLNISFRLNMDARFREGNYHLFEKAYESGCTDISFGIESGSQMMLDTMNKQTTVHANMAAIMACQDAGMKARAYFMVNFPGETEKTVEETLQFAEDAQPDSWLLSAFAPLPGSMVYDNPERFGITSLSKNWDDYYLVGRDGMFKPCFTTEYLTYYRQEDLHKRMWDGLKERCG